MADRLGDGECSMTTALRRIGAKNDAVSSTLVRISAAGPPNVTAGYSGTPLAKKLGIKEHASVVAIDAPNGYRRLLEPLPAAVRFSSKIDKSTDIVHIFSTEKSALSHRLASYRTTLDPHAAIWVSWPKKSAKVPTDITEDVVRAIALPLGLVDVKVCAVDDVWSGLKLVVRKALR